MANSDDRILLNLVLNEATVSAVEGRVRNLVNRLNNQNISLNINGRNLDNIANRLNDIQQRMQTINSTPVNINANLTSAQQQYRLETERMRVAQQLELSRQRTLQTENQAISALAQQNRTLTVNNNVTHQIEQGAQNIGHNMNVAGGHARDFVDYLADGVRYIVVYRSLYEIMNQIGEAFSEMKNVDKELISVRKTTGMAENEIEKIRKASYGVATEYGRTASEYLGSVSEFARGGYKELSTELAKVSLLTQNVGDVSADSANKMLLSVDAAYKLNGDVTELTNVVNGLNNIANLNPTSMQKMADGMQVSASMAKVAGLEISDLVALIGTGTAVTQREGGEIARAIRTIMMNIRQVKGELEDGTVIDDDSIAKAEAALKGVGIVTKEVVNGVRELRDPMDILDELAGKWSTLNTEAQSVILEGLANKRQANVLAAILENYEMVGKMQSEYFNSANSAVKENELYLQGWEATQKRVSAKWTEFIAGMADTAVITGSLNALYGVLVALDTPIGRIATSIVLVNTALAVSGRLWQAIRARSIVADILSMGVAERNLGTAIQLVSGHLGRQIAQWAASPFGMATIAVAGITLITSAIEKNSQKLEENAQKAGEAYDKVKQNMNELDDLIKQYNDLQISNEWDNTPVETKRQLHEDINRLLGDEVDKVDILNGKYKETTEELFKQRMAKLPEEEKKAFDNEQAKGKSLWDTAYWNGGGGAGGYNYGTMQATDAEKKYIEKYDNIFDEKWYSAGHGMGASDYVIRFDNFDDFMKKYEEAKKMLQELYNDGMGESNLYKGLNEFIAKFDTKVTDYKNAVEELEKTKAGQKLGNYITQNVGGYIDNLEEYNKVVDWVKSNFAGEDKNNALSFLNSYFSEYSDKVAETSDLLSGDYSSAIKSVSATLSTLQDKYSELKSAQEEYNSTGAISADTMQKLIDNDLLQYLDYSSGKLRINTDALLTEGEAVKINAIQKLQDAMATDLMLLAEGKLTEASPMAQTAVENLGVEIEDTGNKAQTSAQLLAGWAVAAQAAKEGAEGKLKEGFSVEDFNTQADAIISAYTNAANQIGAITIKSPTSSSGSKSSSSSDADKAEKEALEKFKEGLETREKLLERYKKAVDLTDFGLDLSEENDFALRADLLNNKMSQLTSYGLAMREEFDRVASIIPKTGEEAEALASHLESLGSDMRDNIKNLRETQVAMEQLKIDSIASIGDYYLGDLENELSNIEKRIELLNKDNKKDYKYTNKILQMEMFLPTASSTTGAQNRRRQADQEIINAEQATQDVLNDMFEEQIKKNDKLREEERQALLDDMETMHQDVVLKLESVNKDYDSSWKTAQDTTNTGIANIENSLNNMDMTIPAPDISAVVTACEQVKDMLDHMGDADYTPPKLRISDGIDGGDANSIIRGNKPNIVSNVAKNQLGVPYVWGGIAPGEGLDCSGLTQYAYGVAGVSLPRRSQEQWSCGMGTRIDWKDLKKGDQLFFGSNGEATHTGIYVGNGQMIHAPHTGDVVKYSSIDSEYYQSNFLGAKRYAAGTPKGNAQASRFGIAGENFKPEILIDKATGKTKYIDMPTLIDITKTDVVGERATAKIPKFATGTPMANEKYLKEIKEACEAFDVPYNIALSLIDQESANGTASDTWRKNSAGAVGLTQITASALGDFRETQHQVTRGILDKLSENNVNFENSRTESESAYRDNIWTGIANLRLLNDRYFNGDDSTWKKTLGWYYAGGAYNGSKGQWYANQVTNRANSQPFVDVAKALGDNTIALENNTFAIEETDPNKLKSKEIQEYVNGVAGEISESVSSTRVQQIQILNDDGLSDREKTFELFNIYEPAANDAAEIGHNAWNSLYNEFMDWWQKTETGEEIFNQEIFDAYVDGLSEIKEGVIDVEENAVGLKETIVGYMEDDLAEIDDYIEKHNFYNDWDIIGDTEADAIERQMDIIRKYYDEGIISKEEYLKRSEELTRDHIEAERRFYDSFFDDIESEISKTYDIRISRLNSESSLLSTHFNLVNAISEEQHNLNKELLEAEIIGARMNEQERKTLFTKKEHARLSGKLNDIMLDITALQSDYQHDLATATEDTIEEITNNYERQYKLKMKEYEIVKAELSLAKAQQQLENVKNEKSVRTWTGSGWSYEANLQDVLEAESAAEDARYEVLKAKTVEGQEITLNAIAADSDALQTEKNKFTSALEEMSNGMDKSGRNINSWLKTIAETDLPMFDEIVRIMGGSIKQAFGISDEDISSIRNEAQVYNDTIAKMQANSEEWHTATPERQDYLEAENVRMAGLLGLDYDKPTGRWKKPDGTYGYATGTPNAHKGLGLFDEEGLGSELILTKDGVLTQFQGGEHVFSPEMADRLWQMAQQNYNFAPVITQPDFGKITTIEERINNAVNNAITNNAFGDTIMVKDVHVNDPDDKFRGFVDYLKRVV